MHNNTQMPLPPLFGQNPTHKSGWREKVVGCGYRCSYSGYRCSYKVTLASGMRTLPDALPRK